MFTVYHGQILHYVVAVLSCFSFLAIADDLYWEEANWLEVQPDDVNPDINRWSTYEKAIVTTVSGSASTYEQWAPTDSSDLGVIPVTTTVDGHAQVTSTTQYVQFAAATVTQGGSTAVETSMLLAPGIWSDIADAGSTVCGGGFRKRQFCDLSKTDTNTLASALINTFAKKDIVLGTTAILGLIELLKAGALNRPEIFSYKITGILPTAPPTSSDAVPTGWIDPTYSNEASVVNQYIMAAQKSGQPFSASASTTSTSTSLACSSTASATISADAAYSNIVEFCGQQDHLVPINPTASTSQNFPGLDQNNTLSVSWASGCNSNKPPYTLNTQDCETYLNVTVNGCDTNSNTVKHGGAVTAECVVYEMTPTGFAPDTTYDNPPPPPDPTVTQLSCASGGASAITFDQWNASTKVTYFCNYLRDFKVAMSGNPNNPNNKNGPSSGMMDDCGITSNPNYAIGVGLTPQLASPCTADNVPVLDFSDPNNYKLCMGNLNSIINRCGGMAASPPGNGHDIIGGAIVQNCYRYTVGPVGSVGGGPLCNTPNPGS